MEIWCEIRSTAFYRNSQSFFIDATAIKIDEGQNNYLQSSPVLFSKLSIKFTPTDPREYDWITTWPYLAFRIVRVEEKKFNAKSGGSEVFIASSIEKCELSKVESLRV